MTWVRLDDSFPTHPKISRLSDAQFRYYVIALCYSSRHLTDGLVIPESLPRTHPSVRVALVAAGLFEETPNGLTIHDFLDFQRSRAEVLAIVEKRREAGRLGGRPRKQTGSKMDSKMLLPRKQIKSKGEPTSHPIPSHPSPTGNGEAISEGGTPGDFSGVRGNGTDPDPAALGPPRRHEATRWPAVLAGLQATLDERDFGVWLADTHELETSALMVEARTPIFAEEIARRWKGQILALAHEPVVLVSGETRLILEDEPPGVKPAVFTVAENA